MKPTAIVTGSNQGIGYEIAKGLCEHGYTVIMACRDPKAAAEAEEQMKKESQAIDVLHCKLDLGDLDSIHKAAEEIKKLRPDGVDVLVNNAAFAYLENSTVPFPDQVVQSLKINYYGTKAVTETLLPLVKKGGRVVNLASRLGLLNSLSEELAKEWRTCKTTADIEVLLNKFTEAAKNNTFVQEGWTVEMAIAYSVSKIADIALTRAHTKQYPEYLFYSCCPGYCNTRLNANSGPKSPKDGADTAIWLSTEANIAKELETGSFVAERQKIEW